jgi:hypothetical protein
VAIISAILSEIFFKIKTRTGRCLKCSEWFPKDNFFLGIILFLLEGYIEIGIFAFLSGWALLEGQPHIQEASGEIFATVLGIYFAIILLMFPFVNFILTEIYYQN